MCLVEGMVLVRQVSFIVLSNIDGHVYQKKPMTGFRYKGFNEREATLLALEVPKHPTRCQVLYTFIF